jgi:predicted nucleic acid-binding protein
MNLLDTGAIIDMLKAKKYRPGAISPLSLIETLRGIENKKRTKIKHLLEESFAVINLDNKIIETYCDLYRKLKKDGTPLPDADLLIAAKNNVKWTGGDLNPRPPECKSGVHTS